MDFTARLVGPKDNLPNLESEKDFGPELVKEGQIYLLNFKYDASLLRIHGFAVPYKSSQQYTQLSTILQHVEESGSTGLNLLVRSNKKIISGLQRFLNQVKTTQLDYNTWFKEHPNHHFLQIGQLTPVKERPKINVAASPSLDSWSEYSIIYGYGAVYEFEATQNKAWNVRSAVFKLRAMDVPNSKDAHYICFLEKSAGLEISFQVGDSLKLNFDVANPRKENQWSAQVIEPLPYTPQGDVCIVLTRPNPKFEVADLDDTNKEIDPNAVDPDDADVEDEADVGFNLEEADVEVDPEDADMNVDPDDPETLPISPVSKELTTEYQLNRYLSRSTNWTKLFN